MPLPYTLHKNSIRKGGAKVSYRAVAKNVTYVSIEYAIQHLTQPGSILKQTECHAVIHGFLDYLDEQLAEGNGFLSPYFRLTPGVRGVFEHQHDPYDANRHRPGVNFRMGKKMQRAISRMKLRRIHSDVPTPSPTGFQDWMSDTENQLLTSGQVGLVVGERLKITDPDDPNQGVFLTHLPTQQVYRAAHVHHNYPKQILMSIPKSLPAGRYQLEVRSAYGTTAEIRTGQLLPVLTVS